MQKPTAEDVRRDLTADLALCQAATPGPWVAFDDDDGERWAGQVYSIAGESFTQVADTPEYDERDRDMAFIAAAREGWEAAIRRASHAETTVRQLRRRYACSALATLIRPLANYNCHHSFVVEADSPEEAEGKAWSVCRALFPFAQGWRNHSAGFSGIDHVLTHDSAVPMPLPA